MVNNQVAFFGMLVSDNCVLGQGHSGSIAIDTTCMFVKLDTITIKTKTTTSSLCDFDSNSGDEFEI